MTKIFVVEDEAVVALELKDHLRDMGYEVCGHAARGASALAQIPIAAPDLVLMDINLRTGLSGLEVAERLRAVVDVPVIFLTAYSDTDLIEWVGRIRSYAYLVKPYDPRVLRANIEMALVLHQGASTLRESDAFTTSVLNSLSAEVAVLDMSGVVVAVNAAWLRFGPQNGGRSTLVGADYLDACRRGILGPNGGDAAAALDGIESVISGARDEFRMEYPCHAPGEARWFSMRVMPLRGPRPGVVVAHENVTARRIAEDELRDSERRYRRLFEDAIEGMYEVAADGTVFRVNMALAQLLGFSSPDELVGRSLAEFYEDPAARGRILEAHRDVDSMSHVDATWRSRTGARLHVELFGRTVRGDHDEVLGFHGIVRDVTARRRSDAAEAALSRGLAGLSGRLFFEAMAQQLAAIVGADVGFIGALVPWPSPRLRTLGFSVDGVVQPPIECVLAGTASEDVLNGQIVVFPHGVCERFPRDLRLGGVGAQGYVGVPLSSASGHVIGCIGVANRRPFAQLEGAVSVTKLFAVRAAAELERQRTEARFVGVFEHAPDALLIVDAAGRITETNRQAERTFGYTRDELLGLTVEELVPEAHRDGHRHMRGRFNSLDEPRRMGSARSRLWALRKDGAQIPVEISLSPFQSDEGPLVVAAVRDVSDRLLVEQERERLEEQLRRARKMESLGTLAGGIAHDFNNLLQSIGGNVDFLRQGPAPDGELASSLEDVAAAVSRASELVKQILAFSRNQAAKRVVTAVGPVLHEVAAQLRSTVPEGITIVVEADRAVPNVCVDPTQFHQVLMNLGTNAWHAIDRETGTVSLRLDAVTVAAGEAAAHGLGPGSYTVVRVADDGVGMDRHTIERIFEPFYTTKQPGRGTGLGLAVVHGIVADCGGVVTVDSALACGTTFSVYLPASTEASSRGEPTVPALTRGSARVMMVDDDERVLKVALRLAGLLGYHATGFTRATEALATLQEHPDRFDVVITDQNMPEMGGMELARNVSVVRPGMPIVLTSGNRLYTDDELAAVNIRHRLDKPWSAAVLGEVLQRAIQSGPIPAG